MSTQNISRIIIHSGPMHFDECLAVCLAGIYYGLPPVIGVPVERRNPTEEELEDPRVLCIDVGLRHEPELGNFDHHQLPRGTKEAAMSLVAKEFGYHEALLTCPWYSVKIEMDACGPFSVAKTLGLGKFPFELLSPFESGLIEELKELSPEAWGVCYYIVKRLLKQAQEVQENVKAMRSSYQTWQIRGVWGFSIPTSDIRGARIFKEEVEKETGQTVAFQISFDDRGEGMTLYRFDDHPRVDFSKLEDHPDVLFAHKGGFVAKTKARMRMSDAASLVANCISD
jgi:hypothetical protein